MARKTKDKIAAIVDKHPEAKKLAPMFKELSRVGGTNFRKAMHRVQRVIKNGNKAEMKKAA